MCEALQVDDSMGLAPWSGVECTGKSGWFMKWVEVDENPRTGDDGNSFVTLCPGLYNGQEDGGDK